MTDDLKIIKQLEKQIGRKLKQLPFDAIRDVGNIGFSIDEKGQVTGLNLDMIKLTSPILTTLSTLHHLGCYLVQCQKTIGRQPPTLHQL